MKNWVYRHRGREGKTEFCLWWNECENVGRVLWENSAYSSTRASFMKKLLWENKFDGLLALVKEYIVDV